MKDGGQSWNKLYNYTLIKDSALRWCHTVSICNFTHVIKRNIMKSTLVRVSLNEITVSFQLCTMKDGGQSRNKLYNYTLIKDSALRWCHTVNVCNFTHVIRRNIIKSTLVRVSLNEITVAFQLCTMKNGGKVGISFITTR